MSTDTHSPPLPFTVANGSRIYAADGEEIAVATKASGKHRRVCDETAVSIVLAVNAHQQLVDALQAATDALEGVIPWAALANPIASEGAQLATDMIRANTAVSVAHAALRLAKGDTDNG